MIINSIESLNRLIYIVKESQQQYANFNQEQVNKIFKAVASAASAARIPLAKLACEETGKGVIEDKIIKNHFASEMVYNQYKNTKTCGIISEDRGANTFQVADPVGIIAGIIPVTNPTSTVIFKALISLLSRNAIIFAPHPKAKRATCEAARIVHEAAVAAGAPPYLVGWIQEPSLKLVMDDERPRRSQKGLRRAWLRASHKAMHGTPGAARPAAFDDCVASSFAL